MPLYQLVSKKMVAWSKEEMLSHVRI